MLELVIRSENSCSEYLGQFIGSRHRYFVFMLLGRFEKSIRSIVFCCNLFGFIKMYNFPLKSCFLLYIDRLKLKT